MPCHIAKSTRASSRRRRLILRSMRPLLPELAPSSRARPLVLEECPSEGAASELNYAATVPAPALDYATCDPSSISPHSLECRCTSCEQTGGGIWLQLAALAGRVPLDAPLCDAIPVLRFLILDNLDPRPAQARDAA